MLGFSSFKLSLTRKQTICNTIPCPLENKKKIYCQIKLEIIYLLYVYIMTITSLQVLKRNILLYKWGHEKNNLTLELIYICSLCKRPMYFSTHDGNIENKNGHPQMWPFHIPGIMILTNLNLHYLRLLPHKLKLFWPKRFLRTFFEKKNLYGNIRAPLWPHQTPGIMIKHTWIYIIWEF